jgi:plasmid stabilization system protein ParE
MTLIVLDAAEREFNASVDYYESREPGLGVRFRTEAESVFDRILRTPELPRLRRGLYRRVNFPAFTHYAAYIIRQEAIWVVAIAHAHRRPEFWLKRADSVR